MFLIWKIIIMKNYYNDTNSKERLEALNKYNRFIKASLNDMDLDNLIRKDMSEIWEEVGGQDGMYENFPIIRFYKDNKTKLCRAYALDSYGGIAIIAEYSEWTESYNTWKIVTLGEDDGYHFLNSSNLYCSYINNKNSFIALLSEAISIMNNNI